MEGKYDSRFDEKVAEIDERLLTANDFRWDAPVELSLVTHIRQRVFPCLKSSFLAGESGFIDISLGTDMLKPDESFLVGTLALANTSGNNQDNAVLPPFAGVATHFRTVIVRTRAGTEASRAEFRNWQVTHECATTLPLGTTYKSGANPNTTLLGQQLLAGVTHATAAEQDTFGAEVPFCIPLSILSPFFNTSTLIPTAQLGQLRLEFQFVSTGRVAASGVANRVITGRWSNLEVWTQAYTTVETALRAITTQASQTGLVYSWDEVHTTTQATAQGQFTMQGTKAVSRALSAWIQVRADADNAAAASDVQPYVSEAAHADDIIHWNLGSVYMPVKSISGKMMLYLHSLLGQNNFVSRMWEKLPQLTYVDWDTNRFTFHDVSFERSKTMPGNGSATNSSRPVTVQFTRGGGAAAAVVYLNLKYMKYMLIFSDGNVDIKE